VTIVTLAAKAFTVTGTVSGLMGSCPVVRFSLGGKIVYSNASTVFSGKACADLKNDTASVTGTRSSDTVMTAAKIETRK
jgi:hypothetical protein